MADEETTTTPAVEPSERPAAQEYIVIVKIGGSGDPEVWMPGARISLDDEMARLHLGAGNVRPLETTDVPPEPTASTQVVHDAANTAPKTNKRKGG